MVNLLCKEPKYLVECYGQIPAEGIQKPPTIAEGFGKVEKTSRGVTLLSGD